MGPLMLEKEKIGAENFCRAWDQVGTRRHQVGSKGRKMAHFGAIWKVEYFGNVCSPTYAGMSHQCITRQVLT